MRGSYHGGSGDRGVDLGEGEREVGGRQLQGHAARRREAVVGRNRGAAVRGQQRRREGAHRRAVHQVALCIDKERRDQLYRATSDSVDGGTEAHRQRRACVRRHRGVLQRGLRETQRYVVQRRGPGDSLQ